MGGRGQGGVYPRRCTVTRLCTAHARDSKRDSAALTKGCRRTLRLLRGALLALTGTMVVNEVFTVDNILQGKPFKPGGQGTHEKTRVMPVE